MQNAAAIQNSCHVYQQPPLVSVLISGTKIGICVLARKYHQDRSHHRLFTTSSSVSWPHQNSILTRGWMLGAPTSICDELMCVVRGRRRQLACPLMQLSGITSLCRIVPCVVCRGWVSKRYVQSVVEGSVLVAITSALQSVGKSQLIFWGENPKSGCVVFLTSWSVTTEQKKKSETRMTASVLKQDPNT